MSVIIGRTVVSEEAYVSIPETPQKYAVRVAKARVQSDSPLESKGPRKIKFTYRGLTAPARSLHLFQS